MQLNTVASYLAKLTEALEARKEAVEKHDALLARLANLKVRAHQLKSTPTPTKSPEEYVSILRRLERNARVTELGLQHDLAIFGDHSLSCYNSYKVTAHDKTYTINVHFSEDDLLLSVDVHSIGRDGKATHLNSLYAREIESALAKNSLSALVHTLLDS